MALSYPGVQVGRDENENKIIIRGNSPQGVLWRVEGIDVPNPNHFARPGAAGGGLSIFSAQLLAKSDFSIGGMSAEYGNAIAGAFDIKFREGNSQKQQHFIRAGVLGIDLSTEGPIKAGRSSYLVNYRYSTLGLMNYIRVYLKGERAINTFQDLSFNLVFNSKNRKNRTTLFGAGGDSEERFLPVEKPEERDLQILDNSEERIRFSKTGVIGLTHTRAISYRSSLKFVVAAIGSGIVRRTDTLDLADVRFRINTEDFIDKRVAATAVYEWKASPKINLKTGIIGNFIDYQFLKETYPRGNFNAAELTNLKKVFADGNGNTQTGQLYANAELKPTKNLRLQVGLHYLRLFLNNQQSIEPRFAAKYLLPKGQQVSFAYGLYSQLLPLATYFVVNRQTIDGKQVDSYYNKGLAFPQSHHFIGRYQKVTNNHWKMAAEVYLQAIQRVLIDPNNAAFWMLNYSDGCADGATIAEGSGQNYGLDVMAEKMFLGKYYLLATASVFDAKYTTANKTFNSGFNDGFGVSVTAGREFKTKIAVFQTGFRGMYNGGFRYSPLDAETSQRLRFFNPIIDEVNTLQAPIYYRIDARLACKFKIKNAAATASIDIQNVTANNNYSRAYYNRADNTLTLERKGVGLVPILAFGVGF